MTHYPGGKKRIGKEIAEEIYYTSIDSEDRTGKKIKGYCEPFCGMLGVYQHIPILFEAGEDGDGPLRSSHSKLKYLAGDRDPTVICLWKAAQKGWKPPTSCTKAKFYKLKNTKGITPEKAFLGRASAYKNTYLTGYSDFNNISIQSEHVKKIGKELYDVEFSQGEYTQFSKLKNYIIYCDPPYKDTRNSYVGSSERVDGFFDYEKFYAWCKAMSKNNLVFISEFSMPKGFKKIWGKGKEKLYIVN